MATIVLRSVKGSPLTYTEVDDNFTNLNNATLTNASNISTNASDISDLQNDKLDKSGGTISGSLSVTSTVTMGEKVITSQGNNNQAGASVILTAPTSEVVRLTSASLTSVGGIGSSTGGQKVTLINGLTTSVTILNLDASVASQYRIYTGTGGSVELPANASISLVYDSSANKWNLIGTLSIAPNYIPTGAIMPYVASTAPSGWLTCDGSAVSRISYSALFALIGTTHGQGDGGTTFNLPDYRWSFMRGYGPDITANGSGTADAVLRQATFTNHGFKRSGVKVRLSSGTLSPLATSTDYFTIYVDDNTLAFASTKANALSNTRIAITGANSAVIVQWEDPAASSSRAAITTGGSASGIGSYQDDAFESHTHTYNSVSVWDSNANTGDTGSGIVRYNNYSSRNSGATGSTETRPMNVYVNYIIKV